MRTFDLAQADYAAAIGIDTAYGEALLGRGQGYERQGNNDLAISDYRAALADDRVRAWLKQLGAEP